MTIGAAIMPSMAELGSGTGSGVRINSKVELPLAVQPSLGLLAAPPAPVDSKKLYAVFAESTPEADAVAVEPEPAESLRYAFRSRRAERARRFRVRGRRTASGEMSKGRSSGMAAATTAQLRELDLVD